MEVIPEGRDPGEDVPSSESYSDEEYKDKMKKRVLKRQVTIENPQKGSHQVTRQKEKMNYMKKIERARCERNGKIIRGANKISREIRRKPRRCRRNV